MFHGTPLIVVIKFSDPPCCCVIFSLLHMFVLYFNLYCLTHNIRLKLSVKYLFSALVMITPASILNLKGYVPRPVLSVAALIGIAVFQMIVFLVIIVSPLRQFAVSKMKARQKNNSQDETDPETLIRAWCGMKVAQTMWKALNGRIYDNVVIGKPAKDVQVVALDNTQHTLIEFAKKGRPLVLR